MAQIPYRGNVCSVDDRAIPWKTLVERTRDIEALDEQWFVKVGLDKNAPNEPICMHTGLKAKEAPVPKVSTVELHVGHTGSKFVEESQVGSIPAGYLELFTLKVLRVLLECDFHRMLNHGASRITKRVPSVDTEKCWCRSPFSGEIGRMIKLPGSSSRA
jgi:hypothetical protein